jgi:peptidyl-prolyl cis-trans isomerase A (cyclophilin A)
MKILSTAPFVLATLLFTSCSAEVHQEMLAETAPPETAAETAAPSGLLDPSKLTETAPATFKVKFETTKGEFIVEAHRDWAPLGADRFFNLVKAGYFQDLAFFRALDGFMAQFGIHGDPKVNAVWQVASIKDDPVVQSNTRGKMTFAMGGPDTRTTQLFINYGNNARLDRMGFPPFAEVISGMEALDSIYKGYGEGAPQGNGPSQFQIQAQGNAYLKESFPKLDYITRATLME